MSREVTAILANVISILSNVTTVTGLIVGFFWLNNFKKQKRIENLCINAKEALAILTDVEELTKRLFFLHANIGKYFHKDRTKEYEQIQFDLSRGLNKLHSSLLLIDKDENLQTDVIKIPRVVEFVEKLAKVLHKIPESSQQFLSIECLNTADFLVQKPFAMKLFEELRSKLISIHQIDIYKNTNICRRA